MAETDGGPLGHPVLLEIVDCGLMYICGLSHLNRYQANSTHASQNRSF